MAEAGGKDLEVAKGRGVEEQRAGAAILLQAAQVLGLGAEILGGVVNERPGRPEGSMGVGEPEALEVQHPKRVHHGLRPRRGVEVVARQFRRQTIAAKGMQRVESGLVVRRGGPAIAFTLDQEKLGRIERGQDRQEVGDGDVGRDLEFAGRKIEPGGVQALIVDREGGQVVIASRVELIGGKGRAGRKDPGELAANQFAGLGGFRLVADGDLLAGGEELGDVGVAGVGRQPGHGIILPLGQGEPEELRGRDGVVEEELKEVTEPEEQQGILGQPTLHLKVLLHHRGHRFLHRGLIQCMKTDKPMIHEEICES